MGEKRTSNSVEDDQSEALGMLHDALSFLRERSVRPLFIHRTVEVEAPITSKPTNVQKLAARMAIEKGFSETT